MISKFSELKGILAALLLMVPALALAAVTEYPYSPSVYNDGSWETPKTSSRQWTTASAYCSYTSGSPTGVWLFSPELQLTGGNKYTFSFRIYTEKTTAKYLYEKVYAYLKLGNTSASETVYEYPELICTDPDNKSVNVSFTYEPAEDQAVRFALDHVATGGESWECRFSDFLVTEEIGRTMPMPVSGFTATAAADETNVVTLAWTNPTNYNTGEALTIEKLLLSRDGEQIAELTAADQVSPGAAVTYTDTPANGFHTYELTVVDPDGLTSGTVVAKTGYVGKFEGVAPTYAFHFSDDPMADFWEFNTPDGANAWEVDPTADKMSVSLNNVQAIDTHALSPALALKHDKAYQVTYKLSTSNAANHINLEVNLNGPEGTETKTLASYYHVQPLKNNQPQLYVTGDFTPTADGMYTLDFYATGARQSASYYTNTLSITDIVVEEVPVLPSAATDVVATVGDPADMTVDLSWNTPEYSPTGVRLTDLTAIIYRNDMPIASVSVEPGECHYIDSEAGPGYHEYLVFISNANGRCEEYPVPVRSPYVGNPLQLPFTADFNERAMWYSVDRYDPNGFWYFSFKVADGKASVSKPENQFDDALVSPPIALTEGDFINWSVDAAYSYQYSSKTYTVGLMPADSDQSSDFIVLSSTAQSGKGTSATTSGTARVPATSNYLLVVYVPGATYGSSYYTFSVTGASLTKKNVSYHTPPYVSDFATEEDREEIFIVDDSASPDRTFEWTDDNTLLVFDSVYSNTTSTTNNLNDWLITPPITFYTGYTYTLSFEAKVTLPASPNNYYLTPFAIYLGQEPSSAAMSAGLKVSDDNAKLDDADFKEYTVEYTPEDFDQFANVMTASSRAPEAEKACVLHMGVRFGNKTTCYPQVEVRSLAVKPDREIVTGVEDVTVSGQGGLAVVGNTISAAGLIEAYTPAGVLAGRAADSLTLAPGLYIVKTAAGVYKVKI